MIDAGQSKFRFDIGRNDLYTVRERIAWSYANLACAHAALSDGRIKHNRVDWMIRAKLFRGLREGTMRMGSLFDDERAQLIEMPVCAYCGVEGSLSIDHLIPRVSGGSHAQHNLLRACRSCNSSKGKRDLLVWYASRGKFPPILLLRRYLKILSLYCEENYLLSLSADDATSLDLPFDLRLLPGKFPPLANLRL